MAGLDAIAVRKSLRTCNWPVRRPDSSSVWYCSLSFGHKCPHKLLTIGGAIRACSAGFQ